jgi:hypothetical protein
MFAPTYQAKRCHVLEGHNLETEIDREREREKTLNFINDKMTCYRGCLVINHAESVVGNEFSEKHRKFFNFCVLYSLHTNLSGDQGMRKIPPWPMRIVEGN